MGAEATHVTTRHLPTLAAAVEIHVQHLANSHDFAAQHEEARIAAGALLDALEQSSQQLDNVTGARTADTDYAPLPPSSSNAHSPKRSEGAGEADAGRGSPTPGRNQDRINA